MTGDPLGLGGPSLCERLRTETRSQHAKIELSTNWEKRVGTVEDYRAFLARLYGFHTVWEPEAARLIADDAFFEPRRKVGFLNADLSRLGLAQIEITALPRCPALIMRTASEALGAAYVLEGSTLGGQIIARRVEETLGLTREHGCAYHRAYGSDAGSMWRAFQARLLSAPPSEHDAMIATAQRTFNLVGAWLATPDRGDETFSSTRTSP